MPPADRQYESRARYVDNLVSGSWSSSGNGTLDKRYYVLQDALFNVVAVTDTSGNVQNRYAYQPYGDLSLLDDGLMSL